MKFTVTGRYVGSNVPQSQVYLTWDDWNDYSYYTLYGIVYIDEYGIVHDLGGVRIAFLGMDHHERSLKKNTTFNKLEERFFSLGISEEYYEALNKLSIDIRDEILFGLRDIAKNPIAYEQAIDEPVTRISLLRNVSPKTVTGQYRRMCDGGDKLTPYNFKFEIPKSNSNHGLSLVFKVTPHTLPPTNVHVLIGKNGVGKTYLINQMVDSLLTNRHIRYRGRFLDLLGKTKFNLFSNLVFVTFSAFDEARPRKTQNNSQIDMRYHYIGLKRDSASRQNPKTDSDLASEFLRSLNACKIRPYKDRWKAAVSQMEIDPNFRDLDVLSLIELSEKDPAYNTSGEEIFRRMSSGHKIVLLSLTRIVETLQEKSLIIIDEPESHLHPPLLSLFTSILSELLTDTNGVAIIATHSPVVLQEVPKCCIWKLRRSGNFTKADRLAIESYGENVGRLTNEVFGLEVTLSGFYKQLNEYVSEGRSYKEVIALYGGSLGMEARDVLMGLINERDID